jgi:hypothetical protein
LKDLTLPNLSKPLLSVSSMAFVRERTIPTEPRRQSVKLMRTLADRRGVAWSARRIPTVVIPVF